MNWTQPHDDTTLDVGIQNFLIAAAAGLPETYIKGRSFTDPDKAVGRKRYHVPSPTQ
jgi:hypothetical protein